MAALTRCQFSCVGLVFGKSSRPTGVLEGMTFRLLQAKQVGLRCRYEMITRINPGIHKTAIGGPKMAQLIITHPIHIIQPLSGFLQVLGVPQSLHIKS